MLCDLCVWVVLVVGVLVWLLLLVWNVDNYEVGLKF